MHNKHTIMIYTEYILHIKAQTIKHVYIAMSWGSSHGDDCDELKLCWGPSKEGMVRKIVDQGNGGMCSQKGGVLWREMYSMYIGMEEWFIFPETLRNSDSQTQECWLVTHWRVKTKHELVTNG